MYIKFTNVNVNVQHICDEWKLSHPINKDFILSSDLSHMYNKNTIHFDSNILYCIASSFIDDIYNNNMILNLPDDFNETQRTHISNMLMDKSMFQSAVVDCLSYISDCYKNLPNEYSRFIFYITCKDRNYKSRYVRLIRIHVLCSLIEHLNIDDSLLLSEYESIGYIIKEYLSSSIALSHPSSQTYILRDSNTQKTLLKIGIVLKSFVTIIKHLINKMKNRTYIKRTFINRLHTYNQLSYFINNNPQKGHITKLRFI